MFVDVVQLQQFYANPIGRAARRALRARMRLIWPNAAGLRFAGVGYATPYLRPYLADGARLSAVMPPQQGGVRWPADGPSRVVMADEESLPFADQSIDRLLLVHALELAERPHRLLRECWRVLAGEGRILVVAPNRMGAWARFDRTPFGHGRSYSLAQLSRGLDDNLFTLESESRALWTPPTNAGLARASSAAIERIGERWFPALAGALLVEAKKSLHAPSGGAEARARVFRPLPRRAAAAQRRAGQDLPPPREAARDADAG